MSEVVRNSRFEILTPSGWAKFSGVSRTSRRDLVTVETEHDHVLTCTADHKIKTPNGFTEAQELSTNDVVLSAEGTAIVKRVIRESVGDESIYVYDPISVELGHEYYSESLVSHNCVEFMGSTGTLIAGWKLKELITQIKRPLYESKGLTKYVEPEPNRRYVCVVDVSSGKGRDYSAFSVIDVTVMPYVQVCTYRNNMTTPMDYASLIHQVCKTYNKASVLVEVNGIGEQVGHALHYDLEYENVLFTENAGRAGKRISSGFAKGVDKGIRTTLTTRQNGCTILKLLIEQSQLVLYDFNCIEELTTFSLKGQKYEAEDGCHDDMVMGLVLFAWLSDQQYFRDYTDIHTLAALRDQTDEEMIEDFLFFGFVDDGHSDVDEIVSPTGLKVNWL